MNEQGQEYKVAAHHSSAHGYDVVYEEGPTSWGAYVPDLPGLGAAADTRQEVEVLIGEAIPLHLESMRRDRQERPWLYTPEKLSPELRAVFARIDAA
jgi:predicted RNase H-like HicB family nuclease